MHPYLLGDIDTYPGFLAVAIAGAGSVAWLSFRRSGIAAEDCLWILLSLAAGGLLGAKGYALFEEAAGVRSLFEFTHGYRYPGAIVGCALVLVLFGRRLCREVSIAALSDALIPAVGVGAALLRVGCFTCGCCFGTPSMLPWAVRFPAQSPAWLAQVDAGLITSGAPTSLPVHPLQLYFMLLSLVATGLALWLERRKAYVGQVVLTFLAVDQLGKFGLEYIREEALRGAQFASLTIGAVAMATLALAAMRRRQIPRARASPSPVFS